MQIQDILYYVFWAGLFFVMMRFGCGAHIMGHGHHHGAPEPNPDHALRTSVPSVLPDRVTDPVCGMVLQASSAKTAAYQGQIYYFCSPKCREKFEAAPESYAKPGALLEKEHQHGCC